ncbi:SET domain-containing protein [Phlegmacium glaucopus]|nr:SET domain-containing protein [Phlegmacium glaucopus]
MSLNVAELAKVKGNAAFLAEDYVTARSLYTHAIAIDRSNHLHPLNRSIANLKLLRWYDAEADATRTLELSPHSLKAFWRRGIARKELGHWDPARNDIQTWIDHGGDPTQGAQQLKEIEEAESLPPSEAPQASSNPDDAFTNLHVRGDRDFFTICNSALVQNGTGAFASREFQRGDLILSEKPIFSVRADAPERQRFTSIKAKIENLSPYHLDRFLSLHNSHAECSCFPNLALEIYGTNAFTLNDDDAGICLTASRFNHSCSPNARHSFNVNTGEIRIYALGPIAVEEEIFITYISGRNSYGNTRRFRQDLLNNRYHFTCACSVCSLPELECKMSDDRRVKLNELWESISSFYPTQGTLRLEVIVRGIHLLKEEGYLADADDFANDAGIVCAYHSDWVSARYWADFTYKTRVAEFGEDSMRAAEVRGVYLNPKSMVMAGQGPPKDFTGIRV